MPPSASAPSPPGAPARRDPLLPVDDHARHLGRRLLRCADVAMLATLAATDDEVDGLAARLPAGFPAHFPFASLVTVATAYDGAPLLLLSELSVHTRALLANARCSLLLRPSTEGPADPLMQPRLSVVGQVERLDASHPQRDWMLQRFVERHARASLYAAFPDFGLYRVEIAAALLNGGFARAYALGREDLIEPLDDLTAFAMAAPSIVDRLNDEHQEEMRLVARERCGETTSTGAWRVVGIDPHGIDLKSGARSIRFDFESPAVTAATLADRVDAVMTQARERGD